jgi:hypothetical protein
MKIILTENQIEFIRRYEKIKELIDEGIDVISNDEDFCGFNSSAFIEEVCWQVSDKMEHLNLPTDTVGMIENVHNWVKDNFDTYILEKFEIIIDNSNCNERFDDVDDEEYNLQESYEDKEYHTSLRNALLRRHNVIMSEMDHYMTNNLACDEYPDDVEGFKDYILEQVTDEMMFNHNVNNWEWHDVYLSLEDMIGKQIKKTFKSWTKKHC